MKIWFDTEFIEDGKTIDLLSIGAVLEDGRCYYAESAECDVARADQWVRENVLPHLAGPKFTRTEIRNDLLAFCGDRPEFWAYYADYDWVALCQLYGRMIDLPHSWPMFCMDVKQLCAMCGNPPLPKREEIEHHALNDARWTHQAWKSLQVKSAKIQTDYLDLADEIEKLPSNTAFRLTPLAQRLIVDSLRFPNKMQQAKAGK